MMQVLVVEAVACAVLMYLSVRQFRADQGDRDGSPYSFLYTSYLGVCYFCAVGCISITLYLLLNSLGSWVVDYVFPLVGVFFLVLGGLKLNELVRKVRKYRYESRRYETRRVRARVRA